MAGKTTRRSRKKKSRGNVLRYQIPGLKEAIDIPFPDRKLPVCKRCKKIFKTRELCRVRDGHTSVPWNTTYLCISLDDSCITHNEKGEPRLVTEGPGGPDSFRFLARSLPGPMMPYKAKSGDIDMNTAPICLTCKQKNYTKTHCRKKQKHLFLPWSTVFVMLYAIPHTNAVSDGEASPQGPGRNPANSSGGNSISGNSNTTSGTHKRSAPDRSVSPTEENASKKTKGDGDGNSEEATTPSADLPSGGLDESQSPAKGDVPGTGIGGPSVIQKMEGSRTFLLTIQPDESSTLCWLEFDPEGSKHFVPTISSAEDNERNFHTMTNGMYSGGMSNGGYPMDAYSHSLNQGQGMGMGGMMPGYPTGPWHDGSAAGAAGFPYQGNPEYDMHYGGGYGHGGGHGGSGGGGGGGGMNDGYSNGPSYPSMDQGGYGMEGAGSQHFNPYFGQMHQQQGMSHMGGAPNLYNSANAYYDSFMGSQMNMNLSQQGQGGQQGGGGDPNGMPGRGMSGESPSRLHPKQGKSPDKNTPGQMPGMAGQMPGMAGQIRGQMKDLPQAKGDNPTGPSYGHGSHYGQKMSAPMHNPPQSQDGLPGNGPNELGKQEDHKGGVRNQTEIAGSSPSMESKSGEHESSATSDTGVPSQSTGNTSSNKEKSDDSGVKLAATEVAV